MFAQSSRFVLHGVSARLSAIVQEMRKQREQDAKERAEQLQSLKEEKSIFT